MRRGFGFPVAASGHRLGDKHPKIAGYTGENARATKIEGELIPLLSTYAIATATTLSKRS